MVQIIFISIAVTSIIALMSSIYQLGVQNGKIQAYEEIETNLEKMRQRIKESYLRQLRADTRRSDELLADDNGGGAGTGESTEARKNI